MDAIRSRSAQRLYGSNRTGLAVWREWQADQGSEKDSGGKGGPSSGAEARCCTIPAPLCNASENIWTAVADVVIAGMRLVSAVARQHSSCERVCRTFSHALLQRSPSRMGLTHHGESSNELRSLGSTPWLSTVASNTAFESRKPH